MHALQPLRAGARFGRALGHGEAGLARQLLHRFREREPVVPHGEPDHVAMFAAAETVEEALFVADRERRGFLAVERAQPDMLAPAPGEAHRAPDALADRQARPQVVEKAGRVTHAPPARRVLTVRLAAAKSIRPAYRFFRAAMARPMSLSEPASVSAIASAMARAVSDSLSGRGM